MEAKDLIAIDKEILGGKPVFAGTRVPVETLIDYLEGGHPLDEFLDDFPTVSREQACRVLDLASHPGRWTALRESLLAFGPSRSLFQG